MNGQYDFANRRPGTNATHRGAAFFEVYSDVIESLYGQVKWDSHPMPLDPTFVKKYDGRLISIVGYEFDIIRKSAEGEEELVPSWEQYNHHYNNYVTGKGVKLVRTGIPRIGPGGCADGHSSLPGYKLASTRGRAAPAA